MKARLGFVTPCHGLHLEGVALLRHVGHAPLVLDALLDVFNGVVHFRFRRGAEGDGLLLRPRAEVPLERRFLPRSRHLAAARSLTAPSDFGSLFRVYSIYIVSQKQINVRLKPEVSLQRRPYYYCCYTSTACDVSHAKKQKRDVRGVSRLVSCVTNRLLFTKRAPLRHRTIRGTALHTPYS